jgi:ADP-heptose:LPS heptosyltransferase
LLAPLGITAASAPLPSYQPRAQSLEEASAWLRSRGLAARNYVVIGLGARRAKKQPSAQQVLRWSDALHARHGLPTVFMWTPGRSDNPAYPGDDDAAAAVLAAPRAHLHPFRGPLHPAAGLAWHAASSIFPDSGLMHLAAASPGGVLGFFAETDSSPQPARWGPLGVNVDYLEARVSVSELSDALVLGRLERLLHRR